MQDRTLSEDEFEDEPREKKAKKRRMRAQQEREKRHAVDGVNKVHKRLSVCGQNHPDLKPNSSKARLKPHPKKKARILRGPMQTGQSVYSPTATTHSHCTMGGNAGISNTTGTACFINSTLQLLYYCSRFRSSLQGDGCGDGCLGTALTALFENMDAAFGGTGDSTSSDTNASAAKKPKQVVVSSQQVQWALSMRRKADSNKWHGEQDAHEFLLDMLEVLHEEACESKSGGKEGQHPVSVLTHFRGSMGGSIQCLQCEAVVEQRAQYFTSLPIAMHPSFVGLEHYLQMGHHTMELLRGDNKFECDACNSKAEARKQAQLLRLPKLLLVHILPSMRVSWGDADGGEGKSASPRGGCSTRMLPLQLGLDRVGDGGHGGGHGFELCGVVLHACGSGVLTGGHYATIARTREVEDVEKKNMEAKVPPRIDGEDPMANGGGAGGGEKCTNSGWVLLDDENTMALEERDVKELLACGRGPASTDAAPTGGAPSAGASWRRGFGRSSVEPFLALYAARTQ
jgi:ubiquitin C-terminal hydrolase